MAFGATWAFVRKIDRLLELERVHSEAMGDLKQAFTNLDRRIARLETREDVVINEAKSAARAASSEATQGAVADLARRIGALEAGAASQKRIPRPKPA